MKRITNSSPMRMNPLESPRDSEDIYWSAGEELAVNPGNDLYRFDRDAPADQRLTDLAPDTTDADGMNVQGVLGASADGSYVYYAAAGVPDGPIANSPNCNGEAAESLDCDSDRLTLQSLSLPTTARSHLHRPARRRLRDA